MEYRKFDNIIIARIDKGEGDFGTTESNCHK